MMESPILNVPNEAIVGRRKGAKARARSLGQRPDNLIEGPAPYSLEERLASALRLQGQAPTASRSDLVALIREDRNR